VRLRLSKARLWIILVAYASFVLLTVQIYLVPSSESLFVAFSALFAVVAIFYLALARPGLSLLLSGSKVTAKGIIGEGDKLRLLAEFVSRLSKEKTIDFEKARIGVFQDRMAVRLYRNDEVILTLRAERDTGLFSLEVRQRRKPGHSLIAKALDILHGAAASLEIPIKLVSPLDEREGVQSTLSSLVQ
jgi:hypothetical protein